MHLLVHLHVPGIYKYGRVRSICSMVSIVPANVYVLKLALSGPLQWDMFSCLPRYIRLSRTSKIVKWSSRHCTSVQYIVVRGCALRVTAIAALPTSWTCILWIDRASRKQFGVMPDLPSVLLSTSSEIMLIYTRRHQKWFLAGGTCTEITKTLARLAKRGPRNKRLICKWHSDVAWHTAEGVERYMQGLA